MKLDSLMIFPNKTIQKFDYLHFILRSFCVNFGEFAEVTIASLPIRKKTRANYRSALKNHIAPSLGKKVIKDITRQDIQKVIKPLTPQTAHTVLAVLKTLFREAGDQSLIEFPPTLKVKAPTKIIRDRKFMTFEDLDELDFGKYNIQIRFMALHGVRWGEAVALTFDDVRNNRIYINKSVHGSVKSQSGVRSVPQVSEFALFPKTPRPLRKVLDPHEITIHSLRHTYAYFLKSNGVHVTTAQKLLGHADPRVTMSVYTRVLDDEIDAVGDVLRKSVDRN
jgi:integrase